MGKIMGELKHTKCKVNGSQMERKILRVVLSIQSMGHLLVLAHLVEPGVNTAEVSASIPTGASHAKRNLDVLINFV
jgi:hypothetical protein